jgi:ATP-dependent RNA helicase SUPV3L1/SUV3
MTGEERATLRHMLKTFRSRTKTEQAARKKLFVAQDLYPQTMKVFCALLVRHLSQDLKTHLIQIWSGSEEEDSNDSKSKGRSAGRGSNPQKSHREREAKLARVLFKLYSEFLAHDDGKFADRIEQTRLSTQYSDMRDYHMAYLPARNLKRKFVYHAGPTNSGKTYQAIQRLIGASSGAYCAPLRLLAAEGYDTMNRQGAITDLITGQELKRSEFSTHYACTVEMADLGKEVDVAVLDEIQMICDPDRGYAWTRALLGLPAKEIHLCGDDTALKLVERLAKKMGEELEVRRYSRYKPLEVESEPLLDFDAIQKGDCLIAFSKKEVYKLKLEVESKTDHKCAIIYGNLPPETRRQQAELFNDPESDYHVLVATDAVGMGLNLSVRRIIFTTLRKYSGTSSELELLSASQAKQIAGRAGRRSSIYEKGYVSAFNEEDLVTLNALLEEEMKPNHLAGILPSFEQIEMFASLQPQEVVNNFGRLFRAFVKTAQLEQGTFFMCRTKAMEAIGKLLAQYTDMSLEEKYKFVIAPIDTSNRDVVLALLRYVERFNKKEPVGVMVRLPKPSSEAYFHKLENSFKVLSLYLWLSLRFPEEFVERERTEVMLKECTYSIQDALEKLTENGLGQKNLNQYVAAPNYHRNHNNFHNRSHNRSNNNNSLKSGHHSQGHKHGHRKRKQRKEA